MHRCKRTLDAVAAVLVAASTQTFCRLTDGGCGQKARPNLSSLRAASPNKKTVHPRYVPPFLTLQLD